VRRCSRVGRALRRRRDHRRGSLDRAALAAIAFADADALKDLNKIVHPAVAAEINARVLAERDTDHVVVMDIPLLTENPREGLQAIIVVDVRARPRWSGCVVARVRRGGCTRSIGRQATRERRLETATHVIDTAVPSTTSSRRSMPCGSS